MVCTKQLQDITLYLLGKTPLSTIHPPAAQCWSTVPWKEETLTQTSPHISQATDRQPGLRTTHTNFVLPVAAQYESISGVIVSR